MNSRIWLSPPHMSGREEKYINEAFLSNWIAPLGPNVDKFEQELSAYLDGCHVAVLSSGTAAIHLALVLLGVGPGDEVIASDFTFSATINPVIYQGATPVLVDSQPGSWNMDPALLEEAITDRIKKGKKPKAIIVADIYGMPADMDAITLVARKYDIPLIGDSAESLGSQFDGKPCGSFGMMGILSFNGNKIITTSGGGALVSHDEELIRKARYLASQAKENTLHFEHHRVGYNYRMSNVLAGIGRGQLEVIDDRLVAKRQINLRYRELLADNPRIEFHTEPDKRYFSNFWLTSILFKEPDEQFNPASVLNALVKDNIDSRPLMKPMHLQQPFRECPAYLNGFSEHLFRDGLSLPSGSALTDEDLVRIASWIC